MQVPIYVYALVILFSFGLIVTAIVITTEYNQLQGVSIRASGTFGCPDGSHYPGVSLGTDLEPYQIMKDPSNLEFNHGKFVYTPSHHTSPYKVQNTGLSMDDDEVFTAYVNLYGIDDGSTRLQLCGETEPITVYAEIIGSCSGTELYMNSKDIPISWDADTWQTACSIKSTSILQNLLD